MDNVRQRRNNEWSCFYVAGEKNDTKISPTSLIKFGSHSMAEERKWIKKMQISL